MKKHLNSFEDNIFLKCIYFIVTNYSTKVSLSEIAPFPNKQLYSQRILSTDTVSGSLSENELPCFHLQGFVVFIKWDLFLITTQERYLPTSSHNKDGTFVSQHPGTLIFNTINHSSFYFLLSTLFFRFLQTINTRTVKA